MDMPSKLDNEERISTLRSKLFPDVFDPCIGEISLERARIATRACQENAGLPAELLRATMLEKVLAEIPIYLLPGDLIAGTVASKPRAVEVFPEFGVDWILAEIDTFSTREADKYKISDSDKEELRAICTWWKGRSIQDRIRTLLGEEECKHIGSLVFHSNPGDCSGNNAFAIDYEKVFSKGLNGYIADIDRQLASLDMLDANNIDKSVFLRAAKMTLKAAIAYAGRHAQLARDMAKEEANVHRRKELERIAENCEWSPANPPRTFQEALQTINIIHVVLSLDAGAFIWIPGRLDKYLYPYFRKDIDEGRISKEEAQVILECQLLKYNDSKILWSSMHALFFSGNPTVHVVTVGGVNADGIDSTNDLSYMILECYKHLRLQQPELMVPIHKGTPDAFLRSVCELIRLGTGHPKVGCLDTMQKMKAAEKFPYTIEELRNISWAGCGEVTIPGKERGGPDWAWYTGPMVALELALNNGKSRLTGEQWGLETGDPRAFKSYDELMDAWKKQMANAIRHTCIHRGAMLLAHRELVPTPFKSVFLDDCIERGLDATRGGGKYNAQSGSNVGVTTCGDALAAIKKLVFETKKVTLAELLEALDNNFEGQEELRQLLLSAPKFGNDDDYVDFITRDMARFANYEHRKHPELYGGIQRDTYAAVTGGVPIGRMLGATPDGRKASAPLNEGGISPHQGRDVKGPTAVMKSVSKIDWQTCNGGVLNMKFTTNALKGEDGLQALMALLRSYDRMGGYHVQFNCVDLATLRDAQKHPEKYQDLLVRVGAYASYFVQLSACLQEEIIERTANEIV